MGRLTTYLFGYGNQLASDDTFINVVIRTVEDGIPSKIKNGKKSVKFHANLYIT